MIGRVGMSEFCSDVVIGISARDVWYRAYRQARIAMDALGYAWVRVGDRSMMIGYEGIARRGTYRIDRVIRSATY